MRMKSIYSPRKYDLLVGRTTKTLQRWDREGTLKAHVRLQRDVIIPTISISRLLEKKQKTVDWLLTAEYRVQARKKT